MTSNKRYPSDQYLAELITNAEFAASVPVEVLRVMARELQERRQADNRVFMYGIADANGNPYTGEKSFSPIKAVVSDTVSELNEMQCEGGGDFRVVKLYAVYPESVNLKMLASALKKAPLSPSDNQGRKRSLSMGDDGLNSPVLPDGDVVNVEDLKDEQ